MSAFTAEPLAEDALLLRFGDSINAMVNARVHAAAARLRAADLPHIRDLAPSYASLLVRFDPFAWNNACGEDGPHARLLTAIQALLPAPEGSIAKTSSQMIEIPVCYGGECGPDLPDAAQYAQLGVDAFIARHAAVEYAVAMLGFAPGFPYLLGLDPALHVPRRATPRTRVPAGSVAIGGAQTGIYPRALPGGWHLIGRTPLVLFDPRRDPCCLLAPGDRVRFRPIDSNGFDPLAGEFSRQASQLDPLVRE